MSLNYKEPQNYPHMVAHPVLWDGMPGVQRSEWLMPFASRPLREGRLAAAPAKGGFSVTCLGEYRDFFSNAALGEIYLWFLNSAALFFVAVAASLLFVSNFALAFEQTVPSKSMIPNPTSLKTASRRDQGLDLSKLIRKHTELVESVLFSTNPLFQQPVVKVVPITPTAPALPFVFFGRIRQNGIETIFLSIDKRSFTAKLNDTLDGTYFVNRIEEDKIVFIYLPLKTQQILNIPHGE